MTSNVNKSAEMAFRQLRLSLGDIATQFRDWANKPEGTPASHRMRQLIADHVALAVDSYLSDMVYIIDMADAKSLQSVEMILNSSVRDLNLPKRTRLQDCDEIIRWVQDELAMMLDMGQYLEHSERRSDIYQRMHRINESAINLRFAYNRELQQEVVDAEFSEVRDELTRAAKGGYDLQSSLQRANELAQQVEKLNEEATKRTAELNKYRTIAEKAAALADQAQQSYASVQAQQEVLNEEDSKNALIKHFEDFHESHNKKSTRYFWVGITVLSTVAIFAVIYAFVLADEPFSWPTLAWKLAVVAGGSAIGTYLLRQSNYHRRLSVWSDTVGVQLQTFTPYIQLIGEESARDQLRMEFARRVFGNEPGADDNNPEPPNNAVAVSELAALMANVAKIQSSAPAKGSA